MIAPNDAPSTNDAPPAPKSSKQSTAPTVEALGAFEPGQKVKHLNGSAFEVRYQTPEGVALLGVANLVHPSALKPV